MEQQLFDFADTDIDVFDDDSKINKPYIIDTISDIFLDTLTAQTNQSHAGTIFPKPYISNPIEEIPEDTWKEEPTEH